MFSFVDFSNNELVMPLKIYSRQLANKLFGLFKFRVIVFESSSNIFSLF